MTTEPRATYVHTAELLLRADDDPRAPGGAVTLALCGAYDHDPPCRWPHNNSEPPSPDAATGPVAFRTVFAASPHEAPEVRARIETALRSGPWQVLTSGPREPDADERALGARIANG